MTFSCLRWRSRNQQLSFVFLLILIQVQAMPLKKKTSSRPDNHPFANPTGISLKTTRPPHTFARPPLPPPNGKLFQFCGSDFRKRQVFVYIYIGVWREDTTPVLGIAPGFRFIPVSLFRSCTCWVWWSVYMVLGLGGGIVVWWQAWEWVWKIKLWMGLYIKLLIVTCKVPITDICNLN